MTRATQYASMFALSLAAAIAIALSAPHTTNGAPGRDDCTVPDGWFLAGTAPTQYTACKVKREGGPGMACLLSSEAASSSVFGNVMQSISATEFVGKRVRLSAQVRSENVTAWSGVWLRVDRQARVPGAFDNMQNRPITGTTDWSRYDVVLDVAPDAMALSFGVLQCGAGSTWIDNMKLEVVTDDVPLTDLRGAAAPEPTGPINLDFEQ